MTRFPLALAVAAASGYVSLSQEMLWMRAMAFATAGRPETFASVLGYFLLGVAFGALLSERLLARRVADPLLLVSGLFLAAGTLNHMLLPAVSKLVATSPGLGFYSAYAAIALTALTLGGVLPLAAAAGRDAGGDDRNVGRYVSWIYVANIVGSTAGPLVTGFWLFDTRSLTEVQAIITLIALGCGAFTAALGLRGRFRFILPATGLALAAAVVLLGLPSSGEILHRFHYKREAAATQPYKHLVENRSGVVTVIPDVRGGPDIISGGGVFDGCINADPHVLGNGIERAYMMAGLHANPRRVLEIGLASGSWTKVMSMDPRLERLDVVEINPGYPALVALYPEVADILAHPKVHLHDDDGRRWLKNHQDAQFDFILQNTTWHWRSNITALISEEYLSLVKSRLAPGGVFYYNTTFNDDIVRTALASFKHVVRFSNFIAASDAPFAVPEAERRANLLAYARPDGTRIFTEDDPLLERLATAPLEAPTPETLPGTRLITDDNMLTEYKLKDRIQSGDPTWLALWNAVSRL